MTQPMQTKDGGKHDGEDPKNTIVKQSSLEQELAAAELAAAELSAKMAEQDRQDRVGDDYVSILTQNGHEAEPEGDDRGPGRPHGAAQITDDRKNADTTYDQHIFDAVEKGSAGKLDKLLSRATDSPDCRDRRGRTPLMVAAEAGNAALVGVLLRHGADIDAVDNDGETVLMKAAYSGYSDVVELLRSHGADVNLRNNERMTALEIAREMGNNAVISSLTVQVAKPATPEDTEEQTDPDDGQPCPSAPATSMVPADVLHESEPRQYVARDEDAYSGSPSPGTAQPTASNTSLIPVQDLAADEMAKEYLVNAENLEANEEKIVFDAWDNKQVRSVNEKCDKIYNRAGLELGDHSVDTTFKGSYMAVLKPRSQEYKRFRKLWKHPDLLIDPRRWREWTGAAAVRRYCLAEGIDVEPLSGSHLIELYCLKDLKLILTLAEEASTKNYTVRQLKRAIEQLREHKDDHDPGKVIIKTLDQPVPLLDDPDLADLCTDKERVLEELSKAERKKIRALIKTRKSGLDEWKNLMDTFEGILSDLEEE